MTTVRIYQPLKNAMQAAPAKTKEWLVAFESRDPLLPDPLMGWTSSQDMNQELCLVFPSLLKAIEYSRAKGFRYTVCNPKKIEARPKNYAFNFTCQRVRGE
jgi:hypothetical protein